MLPEAVRLSPYGIGYMDYNRGIGLDQNPYHDNDLDDVESKSQNRIVFSRDQWERGWWRAFNDACRETN